MPAQTIANTIQLIIAPVVMVTACAIILSGLLTHYAAVNDRLRLMTRERLDLLRALRLETGNPGGVDPYTVERLDQIDRQMPELLNRHQFIRQAVLAMYSAILIFILSMFVIAIAVMTNAPLLATAALAVFLAGTAALLVSVLLVVLEIRVSHRTLQYEVERVLSLHR